MQSRPFEIFSQNWSISPASGNAPLTPTMAIASPIVFEKSLFLVKLSMQKGLLKKSRLSPDFDWQSLSKILSASGWEASFISSRSGAFVFDAGIVKNFLTWSGYSFKRWSLSNVTVGNSKNVVGVSSNPYSWFRIFPNPVNVTESNPNSLSSESTSTNAKSIFKWSEMLLRKISFSSAWCSPNIVSDSLASSFTFSGFNVTLAGIVLGVFSCRNIRVLNPAKLTANSPFSK